MTMIIIILIINIVYVSFLTIRMLFTLKGQRYLAALLSSVEVFVYILGLGLVLENLDQIQNLIAYAVGFALGVLVGTKIEEKLALGYVTVKVISKQVKYPFADLLREKGFGVTSWVGKGMEGERQVMEILTSRKDQKDLYNYVIAMDPSAFIISYEPQHFHGGFWVSSLKKYAKKRGEQVEHLHEENLPGVNEEEVEEIKDEIPDEPVEEKREDNKLQNDDNRK
ncbi:DUF2179 domain-containing protein [Natranaerobius thermophilus]|uniref:UPF0316 protein Nther_2065 n=1 Tax=Natranaerobius thermophilus (strain ATCC BAA-1301 / DSM 18059 / JW/NM-WN-LF) TaxID=457570 RepID=B2A741_NATTJ|nr:conserved hypothetical protein [Natranaerobius thermophilus JW/NM-WN-LF]